VLTSFLTGLLSSILRPILEDLFKELRLEVMDSINRTNAYKKYDDEAVELSKAMADATTSEERYAILGRIQDARAVLND